MVFSPNVKVAHSLCRIPLSILYILGSFMHDIAWILYGETMRYSLLTCVHATGPFAN